MLPISWMRWPSLVTASSPLSSRIAARDRCERSCLRRYSSSVLASGRRMTMPSLPSTIISSPSSTSTLQRWQPTTEGRPSARATIEVWPVRPPRSVTMAMTLERSIAAAWLGVSSCATTTAGASSCARRLFSSPMRWPSTRRSRSMMSLAFCSKTSLPMRLNWSTSTRNWSATACSAVTKFPEMRRSMAATSALSRSRPAWNSKILAGSLPSSRRVRSLSSAISAPAAASAACSRACCAVTSDSSMVRCGTTCSAEPTRNARPTMMPWLTAMPLIRCMA